MISNDSPSITLDEADQKKIGLVQNRLTILQGEVLEATKNLDALQKAIAQGEQNRQYLDESIEQLKPELVSLEKQRDSLKGEVRLSEQTLREHQSQHEVMVHHHESKKREHDTREETIRTMNAEAVKKATELLTHEKHLTEREQKLTTSETILRDALESLT